MDISRTFSVSKREENLVQNLDCCKRMRQICSIYIKLVLEGENAMIFEMVKFGFTSKDLESLPFGIAVPLREAIRKCQENPPEDWPEEAYILIGIFFGKKKMIIYFFIYLFIFSSMICLYNNRSRRFGQTQIWYTDWIYSFSRKQDGGDVFFSSFSFYSLIYIYKKFFVFIYLNF